MKTSKVLMPAQMYKVFENPKCKNSGGIRFSTEENQNSETICHMYP
jgi:hypothetical protein